MIAKKWNKIVDLLADQAQNLAQDLISFRIAWLVFGGSILFTMGAAYAVGIWVHNAAMQRFELKIDDVNSAIERRMLDQAAVLSGGVGLFKAYRTVTRQQWKDYSESLHLQTYLPGVLGFGYAELINPKDRAAHIDAIRREGFPNYTIQPAGEREQLSAIIYLEPFSERNQRAFGFDMWSNPTRREAMERARDTGEPAVSGMLTLVQENGIDVQNGFLMYLPVYRWGMPAKTVEERRSAIQGFVHSPFRVKDLMQGILGKGKSDVEFRIYDSQNVSPIQLLYSSSGSLAPSANWRAGRMSDVSHLTTGGRVWTIEFAAAPDFESGAETNLPSLVASGSLLIDIFLFLTMRAITGQREHARAAAVKMTAELRGAKNDAERAARTEHSLRRVAQDSNTKLREANDGLTRFASIVAHDLRAPLKRTEAFVQILDEEFATVLDEEGLDILRRIKGSNSRMRNMLEALQEYTRSGNARFETRNADLAAIIDAVLDTLFSDVKDADITIELGDYKRVQGDPVLLQHVFFNLIGNALKFSQSERPRIIIAAKPREEGMIEISVADNGIGIPQSHAEKVFDMFVRLHNDDEFEGTGVGLSVCKRIIGDHGGAIWVDQSWSPGTRMSFTLKISDEDVNVLAA